MGVPGAGPWGAGPTVSQFCTGRSVRVRLGWEGELQKHGYCAPSGSSGRRVGSKNTTAPVFNLLSRQPVFHTGLCFQE